MKIYLHHFKWFVCIAWLLPVSVLSAQKNGSGQGYPTFDDVVENVSKYLPVLHNSSINERYTLAKKPEGWFWQAEKYVNDDWQVNDTKLCWSSRNHKFVVNKTLNKEDAITQVKSQFSKYGISKYNFLHENFFGYKGWTDDVIKFLADSVNLCDYNYESLARAYFSEAAYRVGKNSDFAIPERTMKLEEKPNCMTPAQLDTFRKYEHLAAETYLRLHKQNPHYETMVGDAWCKYSDEVMAEYLIVAYYQNMAEANKELKDGLYDNFMIAFAKDLLNSCGHNGILFTQGDNDTYPLYYVQAHYGYRTDVLVVNVSLVGTARYINFVRSGVFDAPPFPLTLDTAEYAGDSSNYIYKTDSRYDKLVKATGLDFKPGNDPLYKGDIMLLNMIAANKWERPIYISLIPSADVVLGMDKYFLIDGLACKLNNDKSNVATIYNAPANTAFSYPFWIKKAQQIDWKKVPFIDDCITRIIINYQGMYSRVAEALYHEEKYDECVEILDKYLERFPQNKIPYSVFMVNMPDLYAKCKHLAQAKALAIELTKVGNKGYEEHINNSKNETPAEWKRHMDESLYILQQLVPLVKEYYVGDKYAEQYEADFNVKRANYYRIRPPVTSAK